MILRELILCEDVFMPCHSAILSKSVSVQPDMKVDQALKALKKAKVTAASVISDDGEFQGIFSMKILLSSLIPVSVAISEGVHLDIKLPAAPGVSKRLNNIKALPVSDVMNRKPASVTPDAPVWEGVSLLTKHGNPLCVVDSKGKFHGLITYESLVEDLSNMETTDS